MSSEAFRAWFRQLEKCKARKELLRKRYYVSIIGMLCLIPILNWSWHKVRFTNLMLFRHRLDKKGLLGWKASYLTKIEADFCTLKQFAARGSFTPTELVLISMSARRSSPIKWVKVTSLAAMELFVRTTSVDTLVRATMDSKRTLALLEMSIV